jgi:hypothetical protein
MDISTIDDVIYWINRQPEWEVVDTADVVRASRDADIPDEARSALQDLPVGIWSRAELVAEVRELMVPRIRR